MKGVEGDALIETIVDKRKAIENMLNKVPTGKQAAARDMAALIKKAGRVEKEIALNAVKVILGQQHQPQENYLNLQPQEGPIKVNLPEQEDGETASAQLIESLANRAVFLLGQETIQRMDKDVIPVMSLDKIPPQIKQGVGIYKQFIDNVFRTLVSALGSAHKKAEELEGQRLKASGDQTASKVNIKEIMPYLTQGRAANLGLGSAQNFGELKAKLNDIYSQIGDALQNKVLPAFNLAPFDGELKGVGDKIKTSLGSTIDSLKKG